MLKSVLLFLLPLALTACSILPQRPANDYYTLNIPPLSESTAVKRIPASVQIYTPRMNPAYSGNNIYILGADSRVYKSDISRFVTDPVNMIESILRSQFDKYGPWKQVLPPNSTTAADYSLIVSVDRFYGSTKELPARAYVSMTVQAVNNRTGRSIFLQTFASSAPVADKTTDGLVAAFSRALGSCLQSLQDSLAKAVN
jgi:ABC-type uncharacterized transport system auxiliary subunit